MYQVLALRSLSSRDYSDIRDDVMNDFMIGDMQL